MGLKKAVIGLVLVIILGVLALVGYKIYDDYQEKHRESDIVMPLEQYYQVPANEAMIIFDETVYEKNAYIKNGEIYIDMNTAKERYGLKLFWAEEEGKVYYTSPSTAYVFTPGEADFLKNRTLENSGNPLVIKANDEIFVSLKFLEQYSNITYKFVDNPGRVLISYAEDSYLCSYVEKKTAIRVNQDIKADLLATLEQGAKVRYIDGGGIQENGFIKVMSEDGVRGYIKSECLGESFYEDPSFRSFTPEQFVPQLEGERVYLGWHLTYSKDSLGSLKKYLADNEDLTVVSPTWYFMNDAEGNFTSYASDEYVQYAHSQGVKVWACLKNDDIDGKFAHERDTYAIMSDYNKRIKLADGIVAAAKTDGVDGVNIDIEGISVQTGVYFIQFLKELSLECKKAGLVLSVDNPMPESYNAFYDFRSQATAVDYLVIMGYDEHFFGSEEAGSVASLDWFSQYADVTVGMCPAKQVIMAVPFYTRIWKETKDGENIKVSSEILEMKDTAKKVASYNTETVWDETEGQNYLEYKADDNTTYKIWIEDGDSLKKKASVIRERNMGGVAGWRLGSESEGTWELLWEAIDGKNADVPEEYIK
ncbi:MAG: glycosyl hydrolase family 18 protein [Lachnospiraceae bacterium]|nr:glycosyl hydrolase family 18 protein [Lachnospiraceae bacterium]